MLRESHGRWRPHHNFHYAVHERHQNGYYGTLTEDSLQVSNTLALHKT